MVKLENSLKLAKYQHSINKGSYIGVSWTFLQEPPKRYNPIKIMSSRGVVEGPPIFKALIKDMGIFKVKIGNLSTGAFITMDFIYCC
jgi:hypothetical protein